MSIDVMVVGSGGREHTLVSKISESPLVGTVYALPGGDGMGGEAALIPGDASDIEGIVRAAVGRGVGLVVVGPENPLAEGVVDALGEAGIAAFGPDRRAARIESSKVFAKDLMHKYAIPSADYRVFSDHEEAAAHARERSFPAVIKADGLAAGKGVTVAASREEGLAALREIMVERRFGSAGDRVIVEDCLVGDELSVMAVTDGVTVVPLEPAQDHKAVYDGDEGPNTGGMGAYSPVNLYDEELAERILSEILQPTVDAMAAEGVDFRGILYAGLMLTSDGPMVLEFNCRFGDPETQVVLPRMESDLVPLLLASAGVEGDLGELGNALRWHSDSAVCVVLASGGYPLEYETGMTIHGLDQLPPEAILYHAGTRLKDGEWVTAGGRVLGVTVLGGDLEAARERAYVQIEGISFRGMHYRRDIGR